MCGILDGRQNVLALQEGVVCEDVVDGSPRAQKLEDIGDADTEAANTGTAAALALLDRDASKMFRGHGSPLVYQSSTERGRRRQESEVRRQKEAVGGSILTPDS